MFLRSKALKNNITEVIDETESIQSNTYYGKDSFEDRLCDDLSQRLLGFLPIEDKLRYECISKQWKSLIFNEQTVLDFNRIYEYRSISNINAPNEQLRRKAFRDILNKCRRIDSIDLGVDYRDQVFALSLITRHCNRLESFSFDFTRIANIKAIKSFGQKFGQSLHVLENWFPSRMPAIMHLIKFCDKLISIKGFYLIDLFDESQELILTTERLESFDITIDDIHDIERFEKLIDRFKSTVRVVSIHFPFVQFIDQYLRKISQLMKLKELNITVKGSQNNNIIDMTESLCLISRNCSHLEKFTFSGSFRFRIPFRPFTQLKQLKYLSIDSDLFSDENGEHLSMKSLKNFNRLTHLTIRRFSNSSSGFYLNISQYLPQLRSLKISQRDKNDSVFFHLSKLPTIEKLDIILGKFKVKAFEKFINDCETIKSVKVIETGHKYIPKKTIDRFISLAVGKPETLFRFTFKVSKYIDSYWDQLSNKPYNLYFKTVSP